MVTTSASLTPTVRTAMQWPFATTRVGSTTYQVFYKSEANMGFSLQATPHQPGGCTTMYLEHYYSGAWHQVTSQSCVPLYSDGWYGYGRALKTFASNDHYRIRGHYTPPAEGAQTADVWSQWTYFTVRPGSPS
jgi:hypothetical protein